MDSAHEILYMALNSKWGIVVKTDNVEGLKQRLAAKRKKNELFSTLSICTSPFSPTGEVWIVKHEER